MPASPSPTPTSHTPEKTLVEVLLDRDGLPCAAVAIGRINAPPSRVFELFRAVEQFPGRVPMISRTRRVGRRVEIELKFKVSLFSTKFEFVADVEEVKDQSIELRWVSGEPRELRIRNDIEPLDDGAASLVRTHVGFDIGSLGWLVKYFLRHHPEIQFGVFSGTALGLQHSLRHALEGRGPSFAPGH